MNDEEEGKKNEWNEREIGVVKELWEKSPDYITIEEESRQLNVVAFNFILSVVVGNAEMIFLNFPFFLFSWWKKSVKGISWWWAEGKQRKKN